MYHEYFVLLISLFCSLSYVFLLTSNIKLCSVHINLVIITNHHVVFYFYGCLCCVIFVMCVCLLFGYVFSKNTAFK